MSTSVKIYRKSVSLFSYGDEIDKGKQFSYFWKIFRYAFLLPMINDKFSHRLGLTDTSGSPQNISVLDRENVSVVRQVLARLKVVCTHLKI